MFFFYYQIEKSNNSVSLLIPQNMVSIKLKILKCPHCGGEMDIWDCNFDGLFVRPSLRDRSFSEVKLKMR